MTFSRRYCSLVDDLDHIGVGIDGVGERPQATCHDLPELALPRLELLRGGGVERQGARSPLVLAEEVLAHRQVTEALGHG